MSDPAVVLRLALKQAIWDRLEQPIEPGMGGPPEPIWETYRPEGVAVLLANHLAPLFEQVGWYSDERHTHHGRTTHEAISCFAFDEEGKDAVPGGVPVYRLAAEFGSSGGSDV